MKSIKSILLAVDSNSDRQTFVNEVADIAKEASAKVTLLSVSDTPVYAQAMGAELSELRQLIQGDCLQIMEAISSDLTEKGIQVTIRQSSGKRYLEIIRESLRGNHDLVMKSADSESAIEAFLFGSTDMQLFRMSPCPVWAFKPTSNKEIQAVMVAVDLLASDPEKSALADSVLQWGKYVASLHGAELHVAHVWSLYGEATLRGRSVSSATVDKLVQDEEQKHCQWLDAALEKNGLAQDQTKIHFHKGEPKQLIPDLASAIKADLLVMGTVGRTGIPGFFIGNTADSVLRQVHCSVLAIKPEGFVTPVKI